MAKPSSEAASGDLAHLTLSVAIFVAVLGSLLLGAVLQSGRESGSPTGMDLAARPAPEGPPASRRGDRESAPAAGLDQPIHGDADLVDRASADERRLQASGNGYTLQFAVVCETQNVRANLEALRDDPGFYLLTMLYRDRACFRLCWGLYDSEGQARAERAIPDSLMRITTSPKIITVADALP